MKDTTTAAASKDFASFLKDGEALTKVSGHNGFEKIDGGKRDGEYLNISHNKRNGQAFELERVGNLEVHVYGKLRIVMGPVDAAAKKQTTETTTTKTTNTTVTTTPTPAATTTPVAETTTTDATDATGGSNAPDEPSDDS